VNTSAVQALDASLGAMMPGCEVMHGIDPQRVLAFAFGGPPVWSVAVASHPNGVHQFLTYGLSRALDPAMAFGFELTMRVWSPGPPPMWPMFLLRTLARYQLSEREIRPGEHVDFGAPISQAPMRPEDRAQMPTTRMTTVLVVPGWPLSTPGGPVEVRCVYGLDSRERDLLMSCAGSAFCDELRRYDPSLAVDLASASLADHPTFRAAIVPAQASQAPQPQASPQTGYIHFACACGIKYAVPAGKMPAADFRIACKMCKAAILVPEQGRVISAKNFPLLGVVPKG
jgi:hypothetical protein